MADTHETRLELVDGLHFVATTRAGEVHLDAGLERDGPGLGTTPMEMQLVTLAGCTAMDVISVLRKMRLDVTAYALRIGGERAKEHPRVYTSILLTHGIRGTGIVEANVRRAIWLSMTKYCPVFAMLAPTVAIREHYEINDVATGAVTEGEVTVDASENAVEG